MHDHIYTVLRIYTYISTCENIIFEHSVFLSKVVFFYFIQGNVAFGENGIREVSVFFLFQYRKKENGGNTMNHKKTVSSIYTGY